MKMIKPKFCKDCKYSVPEKNSTWNLRCLHPVVNMDDAWALAGTEIRGTDCRSERELSRWHFRTCNKTGRLWEAKER